MEKKIKLGEKEVTIKELSYLDVLEIETTRQEDLSKAIKLMLEKSTGLSEEEVQSISFKDGVKLQAEINDLNGLTDFQMPTNESKEN